MQQIINFIIRYRSFLLYIFFMLISIAFTIQTHSFHQSNFFNSSSWVTGNVYSASNSVTTYFDLEDENRVLLEENKQLRYLLFNLQKKDTLQLDSVQKAYAITSGQIIKNSYALHRNYLTINKGEKDGVFPDMGVISNKGIIGIVENTSNRFASVQSILNANSSINAKLKNTNNFGSLQWNEESYNVVQLTDIQRHVQLNVGDTIVTGGMSSIFPENIPIGTINKFSLDTSKSYWRIDVALFNDMTNLKNVYIIDNKNKAEILKLEQEKSDD